jgi:hypothetical protein
MVMPLRRGEIDRENPPISQFRFSDPRHHFARRLAFSREVLSTGRTGTICFLFLLCSLGLPPDLGAIENANASHSVLRLFLLPVFILSGVAPLERLPAAIGYA